VAYQSDAVILATRKYSHRKQSPYDCWQSRRKLAAQRADEDTQREQP